MNKINSFLIVALDVFLALDCLGPSASDYQSKGIVKFEGKTYGGGGKNEEKAGATHALITAAKPGGDFDAVYQIWLTGAKAKGLEELHGKKPSK